MKTFEIHYHDLNEKAQKELLEFVGANDPSEMNWSSNEYEDILTIAFYDIEEGDANNETF